ncbi:MAG: LysM domain-containing protein, partial [Candidatus Thiodiazotropha endolucinida]
YAYQAIGGDEGLPGGVVSRHVVRAGESLQSIAAAYYGSPSYWYLIAEANGLEGSEELKAGTTLSIPNAVANSVNDKESYKVYSESEIIGSTSPEVRVKQKKKKWYQKLVQIIIAAIIIYVAVVLVPQAVEKVATYVVKAVGSSLLAGAAATAAVYGVGVATSAVTQGLAIAADLQEEFDWKAAREMGKNFAIGNEIAGLSAVAGAGNTVGAVLSRAAIELGRQYIQNDGKITNWSGVALAMVGTKVDQGSQWASTLGDINQNRRVLGAGLSVVEKFARGKDVNTLDWTNVAAAAIGGQGGVGRYADQTGALQWSAIARDALFAGGLSLAVGQRFGSDQALDFFGNQLGSLAAGVTGELSAIESLNSNPFLTPDEITRAFSDNDLSAYERQQQLSGLADTRRQDVEAAVRAVAEQQQGDRNWMLDAPDELEWRDGHTTAGVFDPNSEVDTGWGSVLGGPDGVTFTEGMRAELSQTTPADFAALEVDDPTILPAGFPVGQASDAELQSVLERPVPPGADSSSGVIAFDDGLSGAPSDTDLDYAWRGDDYGLSASTAPDDLYTLSPEFGYTTASSGAPVDYGFLPQQGIDMGTPLSNSYSPRVTGEHRSVGAWEGNLRFTGVGQAVSGLWDTVTSLPDYASSYLDAVGAANRDTKEIFRYLAGEVASVDFESPIAGRIQDDGSVLPILGDTIRGTVLASPLGLIEAGYRGDWYSFGQRLPSLLEAPLLARGLGKAALDAPNSNPLHSLQTATHSGRGRVSASAYASGHVKLPKKLNAFNLQLKNPGDALVVGRKDINLQDIRILSGMNDVEFALLTRGKQRMIVRGAERSVELPKPAYELGKQGWRWSGHAHPRGANQNTADRNLLSAFRLGQGEAGVSVQGMHRVLDLNPVYDVLIPPARRF